MNSKRNERGSVLILAIVSIVLMVILGATFIQVTRVQRLAVGDQPSYIDIIWEAIKTDTNQTLRDDLRDNDYYFFGANSGAAGTAAQRRPRLDEHADYPYSNTDAAISGNQAPIVGIDGTAAGDTTGGAWDDTWLAATLGEGFGSVEGWRHISNPKGYFLAYNSAGDRFTLADGSNVPSGQFPGVHVVDNGAITSANAQGDEFSDTNLAFDEANLVDVDGDGIPDSRWLWAPIPQIDGTYYVYAIRLVDLGSMINVNVAASVGDSTGAQSDDVDAPRWWWPSELDSSNFVLNYGGVAGELHRLLVKRGFDTAASPDTRIPWGFTSTPGAAGPPAVAAQFTRGAFWLANPATGYTTTATNPLPRVLTINDELDMRYRFGLNGQVFTGTVLDSQTEGLSTMLDVKPGAYFFNENWEDWSGGTTSELDYFNDNARNLVTTMSGVSRLALPVTGETGGRVKLNLNSHKPAAAAPVTATDTGLLAGEAAAISELSGEIATVYAGATGAQLPPTVATSAEFAEQLAVNIQDYRDVDNQMTTLGTSFGLEALPYISEVYVQRPYKLDVDEYGIQDGVVPGTYDLRWVTNEPADPTSPRSVPGYAIEIRNPFRKPITLKKVFLHVDNSVAPWGDPGVGAAVRDLDSIAGAALATHNATAYGLADDAKTPDDETRMLYPGDALVLYRDSEPSDEWGPSADPSADTLNPTMFTPVATPGAAVIAVAMPTNPTDPTVNGWPTEATNLFDAANPGPPPVLKPKSDWVYVELRGKDQGGTPLAWGYSKAPARKMYDEYFQNGTTFDVDGVGDTDPNNFDYENEVRYVQQGYVGNGDGLNVMSVYEGDHAAAATDAAVDAGSDFAFGENGPHEPHVRDGGANAATVVDVLAFADKAAELTGPTGMLASSVSPTAWQFIVADHVGVDLDGDATISYPQENILPAVGEIANIAVVGPRATRTIGSAWKTAALSDTVPAAGPTYPAGNFWTLFPMLFEAGGGTFADPGSPQSNLYQTHAAVLMSRLTTLFGRDPVTGELGDMDLIPGQINLNTAPRDLLAQVLPFPNPAARDAVADAIVSYRRANNGIRSIWRLHDYLLNPTATPALAGWPGNDSLDSHRFSGTPNQYLDRIGNIRNPAVDGQTTADGVIDDAEERALLLGWLEQVATVRSDRFVAYVLIRGYKPDSWAKAVESARFIQVFDRATYGSSGAAIDWTSGDAMPVAPAEWEHQYE